MTDRTNRRTPPSGHAARRRALLMSCAACAVFVGAMRPQAAAAQGFEGSPTVQAGSVTFNRTTPGTDIITLRSNAAVINWNAFGSGTTLNFLPAGRTAIFEGPANFQVLNRILPDGSSAIRLDGNVLSRLAGGTTTTGLVAFYTPNGLIIGANARFDVGSLLLTTLDPQFDPTSGTFFDTSGRVNFPVGSGRIGSAVTTEAGSQINAAQEGSFVIMAAPRLNHAGSVRVNGSAAYVAASAAELRHNAGIFDILIINPSASGDAIVHSGTTGGPASTGAADAHGIYMAALSRNAAVRALVGGTVGYDAPISATVENGAIILSTFVTGAPVGTTVNATLELNNGRFTSDVRGSSSQIAIATGGSTFSQDLNLNAGTSATLRANAGQVTTIGGNLLLEGRAPTVGPAPLNVTAGNADLIVAGGGEIRIAGDATVDASALADRLDGTIGNATSGLAQVNANSGRIQIGGSLSVLANARAFTPEAIPAGGGTALARGLGVLAQNGGVISVGRDLRVEARGEASLVSGANGNGPGGTGGQISLNVTGINSALTVGGTTSLDAQGIGGSVQGTPNRTGGPGQGGQIFIQATQGGQVTLTGAVTGRAGGQGGNGPSGGTGTGNRVLLAVGSGSSVRMPAANSFDVGGVGGRATGPGGDGGAGTGARIEFDGTGGGVIESGPLTLSADGRGGAGGNGNGATSTNGGAGGNGQGGVIDLRSGTGGTTAGATSMFARGIGGNGGAANGARGGNGGNGTGGTAGAAFGSLTFAGYAVNADGVGGTGFRGGNGTGGAAAIGALNAATARVNGVTTLSADGIAAFGSTEAGAAGGTGNGGSAQLNVVTGATLNLRDVTMSANSGVTGTQTAASPTGNGGIIAIANDGTLTFGNLVGSAVGRGTPGTANGEARMNGAGTHTGTSIDLTASGPIQIARTTTSGATTLTTDGRVVVSGPVAAPTIAIASNEIDVQAPLGAAGADVTLAIRNANAESSFGAAPFGTYILDANEIGRITAGNLRLVVPRSSTAPARFADLVIGAVTIDAARIGSVRIDTPGIVVINGAVQYSNAVASTSFRIAPQTGLADRVEIVAPAGSLRVLNSGGLPTGSVGIDAQDIYIVTQPVLTQLLVNPNFTGRNTALLSNGGTTNLRGYVEGGSATFNVGRGFFVQNNGSATDFAGVTVGSGAFTINAAGGTTPADVYAFGRRINPDGSSAVNDAFFLAGAYNGSFTANAQVNTCVIVTRACPGAALPPSPPPPPPSPPPPPPPPPSPPPPPPSPPVPPPSPPSPPPSPPAPPPPPPAPPPISSPPSPPSRPGSDSHTANPTPERDQVSRPVGGGGSSQNMPPLAADRPLIEGLGLAEPLIEEPVTSGGDSSAWTERDDEEEGEEETDAQAPVVVPPAPPAPAGGGTR